MSLITRVSAFAQAVGADIKTLLAAQPTRLVLGSTVESSSTSWADIGPDLAWDVEQGATYMVLGALVYQSSATTTGFGVRLTGVSGSYARFCGQTSLYTSGGAMYTVQFGAPSANTNPSASVGAADADMSGIMSAIIQPASAGRVSVSIRSEIAGSTVRLMAGSSLIVVRMP